MQTVRGGWLQGPTGTAMIPGSCADSSATLLNVSDIWGSGRGLLEVYWGWTNAASAGHLEEVY